MKTIDLGNDKLVKIKKVKSTTNYNKSVQVFVIGILCFGTIFKETATEIEILEWVSLTEKTL